eukprot:862805-Prorocentrum_lima.AAC.1
MINTADEDRPKVVSFSYGDDEEAITDNYKNRVNDALLKLGLMGTSVLVASGDGAAEGGHPEECERYRAVFPASS